MSKKQLLRVRTNGFDRGAIIERTADIPLPDARTGSGGAAISVEEPQGPSSGAETVRSKTGGATLGLVATVAFATNDVSE